MSRIYVNVYDLHHLNDYLHAAGMGAYHSGVQLGNVEYAFGGHDSPGITGVFEMPPKTEADGTKFRESIDLGVCELSQQEIKQILADLKKEYQGTSYNLVKRNCNTFSNDLVMKLTKGKQSIPSWINRLSNIGANFSGILPPELLGIKPPTAEDMPDSAHVASSQSTPAFGGTGYSLSGAASTSDSVSNTTTSKDAADDAARRREERLAAIDRRLKARDKDSQ